MLSPTLLEALRDWYRIARPHTFMFQGRDKIGPMTTRQFHRICQPGRGDDPAIEARRAHIQAALYGGHRIRTFHYVQHLRAEGREAKAGTHSSLSKRNQLEGGYKDAAFFRWLFKHVTGMTPVSFDAVSRCLILLALEATEDPVGAAPYGEWELFAVHHAMHPMLYGGEHCGCFQATLVEIRPGGKGQDMRECRLQPLLASASCSKRLCQARCD